MKKLLIKLVIAVIRSTLIPFAKLIAYHTNEYWWLEYRKTQKQIDLIERTRAGDTEAIIERMKE